MKPRISIVIPVYNEAERLDACLDAIGSLKLQPYEVIVVDNNSVDDSALVAASYSFTRVIKEKKQGVVHARNSGFDAARGEIIARIDADTVLPADWTFRIAKVFNEDQSLAAVSGPCDYYDFYLRDVANGIDTWVRAFLHKHLKNRTFLLGANMAVRRTAWQAVKNDVCVKNNSHEDLDLAIHLQSLGYKVNYFEQLIAGVSMRRIESSATEFIRYSLVGPKTYAAHQIRRRLYMYPVVLLCWLLYYPAHFLYNAYAKEDGRISARRAWASRINSSRVDPTTNIIS